MNKFNLTIRSKMTMIFIGILCFSCFFALSFMYIVNPDFNGIQIDQSDANTLWWMTVTMLVCVAVGSTLMFFATKKLIKPIEDITEKTKEVAKGNFDVEMNFHSKDEIGMLAENFNQMTAELKTMEYLRKDFISNVSHEFKTPIASIRGFVEIIKNPDLPRDQFDEYTNIILEEMSRLNNLSSNILRISRLDNQSIYENNELFSLDEQIRKTLLLLEEKWNVKNIELEINMDKVNFIGDEELIQEIWVNLLENAIKFSNEYGTLYITLKEKSSFVVVEIEDEGIGMSLENINRIYEKFYQGDVSHFSEGNGLGLAIVKRIIELCGGDIGVESQCGVGTKFTVRLPIISR